VSPVVADAGGSAIERRLRVLDLFSGLSGWGEHIEEATGATKTPSEAVASVSR